MNTVSLLEGGVLNTWALLFASAQATYLPSPVEKHFGQLGNKTTKEKRELKWWSVNHVICHYRNEEGTGIEVRSAIVSGIVTGEAPVSYNSPRSLCESQLGPVSFSSWGSCESFLVWQRYTFCSYWFRIPDVFSHVLRFSYWATVKRFLAIGTSFTALCLSRFFVTCFGR